MQEKRLTLEMILAMDKNHRRNFVNDLSAYKSANMIGTVSFEGITNLAVFNSVVHIGANPPLMGFILRPTVVDRHTYDNIKATGYFTINPITSALRDRAHQTSAKYPKDVSEFIMTGIKPQYSKIHPAPYVQESPFKIGLKIEEEQPIKANGCRLIIGRVIEVLVNEKLMQDDGHVDLGKTDILSVAGLDSYWEIGNGERLEYARVKKD